MRALLAVPARTALFATSRLAVLAAGAAAFAVGAAAFAVGAALTAGPARADEIEMLHPETCERVIIKCAEILPETWAEVEYRERERGPTKKVPMPLVVDIRRTSGGKDKSNLEAAARELDRGNLTEARTALRDVAGGGFSVKGGTRYFTPFVPRGATAARGKRAPWTNEYAHFYYAKALVLEGRGSGNEKLLEEALLCLDDVPNPAPEIDPKDKDQSPGTTGGFLGRFKGGNSRWLPEAMLLKAWALVALKRYDEAAAAFDELFNQAVGVGLSPRWVYEAKLGAGMIAEAQSDTEKAVQAFERAPTALDTLLSQAPNRCLRLEIGRYYSQARARAAALLVRRAEAANTDGEYVKLKSFLSDGLPEALQAKFRGRPPEQLEALMAGARDPDAQAVTLTGLGMAYRAEQRFDDAIFALRSVAVRYFGARSYAAMALYYLALTAGDAAKTAKADVKSVYEALKTGALKQLKTEYPESPYATR